MAVGVGWFFPLPLDVVAYPVEKTGPGCDVGAYPVVQSCRCIRYGQLLGRG